MNNYSFETLTPDNAAMLLVDHQVGTMNFRLADIDALHLKNRTLVADGLGWKSEQRDRFAALHQREHG